MPIKFGTDGWRAVVGKGYTFENLRFCAQGTSDYLKQSGFAKRGLTVGYDTRFASDDFAVAFAEVTAGNGIVTALTDRSTPTPVVSYNLVASGAGGGAVITASHNPPEWNGIKLFHRDGRVGGLVPQDGKGPLEIDVGGVADEYRGPYVEFRCNHNLSLDGSRPSVKSC